MQIFVVKNKLLIVDLILFFSFELENFE